VVGAAVPWSLIDGHWAGPRGTVAVRTRSIDDALAEALRGGLDRSGRAAYRARYLLPGGRQREPLAEYQRAGLADVIGNVGM
jgi:hypothetical protein